MLSARQQSGRRAEELAAEFLRAQGFEIVQRNYLRRLGELDLIARRAELLVIAEVRTRASAAYGGAAASVDRRKQQRITRAARALLQQRADLARLAVRFDVIVVSDPHGAAPRIEWIEHAFEAS
jgi:putative endonuclease